MPRDDDRVVIRRGGSDDLLSAVVSCPSTITSPTADRIRDEADLARCLDERRRRPSWTWLASRGTEVVGRVLAYGHPDHEAPWLLDVIDVPADDPDSGAALLRRAMTDLHADGVDPVEITLFGPMDWRRTSPGTSAVLDAAARAGFEPVVERHRFEWEAGMPVLGDVSDVRPVGDDEYELAVEVYRRTMPDTLDVHVQTALCDGHEESFVARSEVDDMLDYSSGDLSGWRFGLDVDGEIIGLAIVGFTERTVIGYIGVVPEHRGQGLAARLLSTVTRLATDNGVQVIAGETDITNHPMARAFEAVGYPETDRRIDLYGRRATQQQ